MKAYKWSEREREIEGERERKKWEKWWELERHCGRRFPDLARSPFC
jgi:hypothetical protein